MDRRTLWGRVAWKSKQRSDLSKAISPRAIPYALRLNEFSTPTSVMATTASPPPVLHLDLSGTFGVVFWAFVVATALFGVSVVQGYLYYMHCDDGSKKDPTSLKIFVAVMLALDFTTTALSSQSLHDYLVINFGNPLALLYMTTPYIMEYLVTAVVTLLSQLFYASRIHIADKHPGRRYWIPGLICFLSFVAFAFAVASTTEIFKNKRLISGLENNTMKTYAGLNTGFAALCDIVATVAMCVFLASQKSAYKQTRTIIAFLLFFSINRGVLVAVAQLGFLTSYLAAPSKIYWMPFHLSVSKLHVNTLLAMLNSRNNLRARTEVSQVRLSQDLTTFTSDFGHELPRRSSAKGNLRLSGVFQLGTLSKAGRNNVSPTTLASPSSKFTQDGPPFSVEQPMPTFSHPHDPEEDSSMDV